MLSPILSEIKNILSFFKNHKIYLILTAGLLGFYALALVSQPPDKAIPDNKPTRLEEFQAAEQKMKADIGKASSIQAYLNQNPKTARIYSGVCLFVFIIVTVGLFLDGWFIFSKQFRERLKVDRAPPSKIAWPFSMFFKVSVLFIASNIVLHFVFSFLKKTILGPLSDNFYLIMHTTVVDLLCFGLIAYSAARNSGDWKDLGFHQPKRGWKEEVFVGFGAYTAILPIFLLCLIALVVIAELFSYEPPVHPLVNVLLEEEARAPWLTGYSIILATVVGPVLEEVFFRGFCYPIFKEKYGKLAGMLLSASFFAFVHANTFAFWPIFILGLGLTYLYESRKTLLSPIILHISHNTVFMVYFYLAKQLVAQAGGL